MTIFTRRFMASFDETGRDSPKPTAIILWG
jgi:hypothetical protein